MKKSNKILVRLIIFIILIGFFILPTFSKYCNQTVSKIIHIFTRYDIEYITNNGKINDIDKFSSYVSIEGLTLPTDSDVERIGYSLGGWYENTEFNGDAITKIMPGTTGNKTYYANWVISQNPLAVTTTCEDGTVKIGLPTGIDIVNGKDASGNDIVLSLDASGQVIVPKGELISIRIPYSSDYSISNFDIDVPSVVEREYHTGEQYLYYDFKMPGYLVNLNYNDKQHTSYIDISKSSIIFEENVSNTSSSRSENGFWYKDKVSDMTPWFTDEQKGNFYIWDNSNPLHVTSNNVETTNQLILVNGIDVYFKDCNLVARSAYSENVVDRKLNGISYEQYSTSTLANKLKFDNVKNYGNIIFSYDSHQTYNINLYIEGENSIASIYQDTFKSASDNRMQLRINSAGSGSILNLGSVWGNFNVYVNDITLNEYENEKYPDNSEYLFFISSALSTQGNIYFSGVKLNAPNKRVLSGFGYIYYRGNTNALIGSNRYAYNMQIAGTAFVHNLGDIESTYYGIALNDNGSLVLDGNYYTGGYESGGTTVNTTGYLIAKGNNFDAQALSLKNGTIIANSLSVEPSMSITKGTIITNQILNAVHKRHSYSVNGYINNLNGTNMLETANNNEDDLPFVTYSNTSSSPNKYNIAGGNIYLFGHYKVTSDKGYDLTTKATDSDNPINKYINKVINTDGSLKENISLNLDEVEQDVKNNTQNVGNECIMLGNSKYEKNQTKGRSFIVGVSAKIFAAGNLTFYNELTVDGGTIYAGGSISSKQDLIIKSGNITANKIGNKYNLKILENNNYRWRTTNLLGGNIYTNHVGAIDDNSKSTIILKGSTINRISEDIDIIDDRYINYYYNADIFTYSPSFTSLRFRATVTSEITSLESLNEMTDSDIQIAPPTQKNGSSERWLYDSLKGNTIESIEKDGKITGTNISVLDKNYISLYAVKGNYNLTIGEGIDYISSVISSLNDNVTSLGFTPDNLSIEVSSTNIVTLELKDPSMIDKVVVAYKDDSGIFHNPSITKDRVNNTISFSMPYADTTIYITNNLNLHLDKYNIEITKDGFNTELNTNNKELMFEYKGNIIISEEATSATSNKVVFATGSGNVGDGSLIRNIVLRGITQTGSGSDYGIEIADGEDVKLTISGTNYLYPIKAGNNITIVGETGKEKDSLSIYRSSMLNHRFITVGEGSTTIIDNITIDQVSKGNYQYGRYVYNIDTNKAKEVIYRNCNIKYLFYAYASLGVNVENVTFDNCDVLLQQYSDTAESKFTKVNKVTFKNSTVKETNVGGNRKSYYIDYGMNELEFIDSSYTITIKNSVNSTNNYIHLLPGSSAKKVTLRGSSSFVADHRIIVNSLTLYDNSSVSFTNPLGYLLCPDIELNDNASISASHIILSGFYYPSSSSVLTDTEMYKLFDNNKDILDGNNTLNAISKVPRGLVINGGNVTATEFVGGDVNSKIEINNGKLNSKRIGTIGKLFGFTEYNPKVDEPYIYTYDRVSAVGSNITLNAGTINVMDDGYLGGVNARIYINGGTVNLGNNSILGVSDETKEAILNHTTSQGLNLEHLVDIDITSGEVVGTSGIINAPYSTLNITGENTSVNIYNMLAEKGTINIENTNNNYDNPYSIDHGSVAHSRVGIIASNKMSAQNIVIRSGAVVYAKNAIVNTLTKNDEGLLRVGYESPVAYLYSDNYGTDGYGYSTVDVKDNVLLNRIYSIHYNLNDDYEDQAVNNNSLNYIHGTTTELKDASRYGYDFMGWYDKDGNKVTEITSTYSGDITLEARWNAKKVKFKVVISANDVNINKDVFSSEVDLGLGSLNASGDVFTFNEEIEIEYRDLIAGTNKIKLDNYNLRNYKALSIKVNNAILNPYDIDIDLNSAVVTKDMLDYYISSGGAIELSITGVTHN